MKIVINVKFGGFRYVLAYWQTEINSHNLVQQVRFQGGGVNVQWKQSFLSVSLSLLSEFLQSSIYVVHHKLGFRLVTFINCCSKFFKMVLLSPSLNGI